MIVGIDLGTTNSSIAYFDGEQPRIIPNALGELRTPSVVCLQEDGRALVGTPALRNRLLDPEHTITGVKRFIGRRYNEVFDLAQSVPYPVTIGEGYLAVFPIHGRVYTPQEISALILRSLKESAEAYLGEDVNAAVITVPAYFGDAQREATRQAARVAGIDVRRVLDEPTAASLAFRDVLAGRDAKIAVLDLGGGTFDVTLLELATIIGDWQIEVLAVSGDGFLGGDDFDRHIADWLEQELLDGHDSLLGDDRAARQRLLQAALGTKEALSAAIQAPIVLPYLVKIGDGWVHLDTSLTQHALEGMCAELFERLEGPCRRVLKQSNLTARQVDEVLLVGGATRIPRVRVAAERVFGRTPRTLINAQDAVALGAATQAGILSGREKTILMLDVLNHGLGVQTNAGTILLIESDTTIPTSAQQVFTTCRDDQTSVEVHVVEVDRIAGANHKAKTELCRPLARLSLTEISSAPRGVPQIEIKFDIDANHILHVSAKDKAAGRESSLIVRTTTGLSDSEIERMQRDLPELKRS